MRSIRLTPADTVRGPLILVNALRPLPPRWPEPELRPVCEDGRVREDGRVYEDGRVRENGSGRADGAVRLDFRAAALLAHALDRCGGGGRVLPVSGHRTRREQERIYRETLAESGAAFTARFVALPGCSEHETGLAVDMGLEGQDPEAVCPAFPYDGAAGAFRRAAADCGFVERYPAGKEAVTGIGHEPWHFRYVGYPHSLIMRERGLVLEEYIEFLRGFSAGAPFRRTGRDGREVQCYYLPVAGETAADVPGDAMVQVSGSNAGGCILTVWPAAGRG